MHMFHLLYHFQLASSNLVNKIQICMLPAYPQTLHQSPIEYSLPLLPDLEHAPGSLV